MTYSTPQPYDPYAPVAIPKAPPGTKTNTPWIWLVVFLRLVQLVPLFFIDWSSMFDLSSLASSSRASLALMTSPVYLLATLGGWVIYGLCALFAYLDFKQLRDAGVPRPFHFAWVFLSSIIYTIGRAVVVKRRTGHGNAVLWASIGSIVLIFIITIIMSVQMFASIMSQIPTDFS